MNDTYSEISAPSAQRRIRNLMQNTVFAFISFRRASTRNHPIQPARRELRDHGRRLKSQNPPRPHLSHHPAESSPRHAPRGEESSDSESRTQNAECRTHASGLETARSIVHAASAPPCGGRPAGGRNHEALTGKACGVHLLIATGAARRHE
ncbi:hypothetical protein BKA93DRAFT_931276, partial [Sparassis latifolia]